MKEEKCVGCGVKLQNTAPNLEGYTPKKVFLKGQAQYCKRCFQLKHYGKYTENLFTKEEYKEEVLNLFPQVDLIIAIFDIIDFEGSFDDEILDMLREKDSIVVINKVDLIPDEKHPSEVATWVKKRLEEEGILPLDIAITSSKKGYGINGLLKKISKLFPFGCKAMVVGTANVGKSSIINRILKRDVVTVSKYPGTTVKFSPNFIKDLKITIYDTPGIIPEKSTSSILCDNCSQKLIPTTEISRKTFKCQANRVIMVEDILSVKVLNTDNMLPIFSLYASKDVKFHETNLEKIEELRRKDFFNIPCKKCTDKFSSLEKKKVKMELCQGEELVFKGLGWISVKRGPLNIELELPKEIDIIRREAFIKPKRG